MRYFKLFLVVAVLSISRLATVHAQSATTVYYDTTNAIFPNPERGFSDYRSRPLTSGYLANLRTHAVSLVQRIYTVPEFHDSLFSQEFLDEVSQDFQVARDNGFKLVLRFSYTNNQNGEDAALDTILMQINQLQPLLQANYDVISYMEAGFIGAWGEWYYSTHHLNNTQDRRTVLFALLDALPVQRMVAIRTPYYKQNIYNNDQPLTAEEAYSGTNRARTGEHNDCFLADATDYGTYLNIEADKNYLHQDNKFLPQGGETCNPSSYSGCANALQDMARLHYSVLNRDYHPDVLQGWEDNGCMPEIKRRLGYRFQLLSATMPDSVKPGGAFHIQFSVWNRGFASPYNPRNVEIILQDVSSHESYYLSSQADPRFWYSGDTTEVNIEGGVPADFQEGTYKVLLNLSDPEPRLRNRPEYSIRLANDSVWVDSTGFNDLHHSTIINAEASGSAYTGDTYFEPVSDISAVTPEPSSQLPQQFELAGNYPNPFNGDTIIQFQLYSPSDIQLKIYNVRGEIVFSTPFSRYGVGSHTIRWHPVNVSSGIYFYRLTNHTESVTKKCLYLR